MPYIVSFRGGVEDTRLEAKAKNTTKNPRPRTHLPRTDPLEAKNRNARGHGHNAEVLSKKKRSSLKKTANFPQNENDLQKIRFSNFFFRKFFGVLQDETTLLMTLAHFQQVKNNTVLEPRTGFFRVFAGFEAKVKNFKLCPRGQGSKDVLEDSISGKCMIVII